MDPINELANLFQKFPGIGERQSKRFVYFLIKQDKGYLKRLSEKISNISDLTHECKKCLRNFGGNSGVCEICENPNRNSSILMIVEKDADLENIEKNKIFDGIYFVLQGLVPIVENKIIRKAHIDELLGKIKNEQPKEIIIALSNTPNGNHTDEYLREVISKVSPVSNLKTLGRGISSNTEIEYIDDKTLEYALKNRQ